MCIKNTIGPTVEDWFRHYNIKDYGLLEYNEWKGRLCVWFEDVDGVKKILKWNRKDTELHRKHNAQLKREREIYAYLKGKNLTPKFFDSYENDMLIAKYVEGQSLRFCLKNLVVENDDNYQKICNIICDTLLKWQTLVMELTKLHIDGIQRLSSRDEYSKYLVSLLLSGPFDAKKLGKFRLFLNRQILRLFLYWYHDVFNEIKDIEGKYVTHGDFHANNILIENGKIYLIDLEGVQLGSPELELAYFYSQIRLLIRRNKELLKEIDLFIDKNIVIVDKGSFHRVLKVFDSAIKYNSRFY